MNAAIQTIAQVPLPKIGVGDELTIVKASRTRTVRSLPANTEGATVTVTKVGRVWAEGTYLDGYAVKFRIDSGYVDAGQHSPTDRVVTAGMLEEEAHRMVLLGHLGKHRIEFGFGAQAHMYPTSVLEQMVALLDEANPDVPK